MFRKQNKLSEGILCQFLPSICYSLNLTGCDFLRNSVLRQISFYCKNLNTLILDGCKQLSNYSLQSILQNCWKLEVLSLRGCFLITDGPFITSCSLFYGLHALVSLRKLCLSRCSQLSGEFAVAIVKNCSQLRYLDISYCRHISQDALQKLFVIFFTELDVSYIRAVADESFRVLIPHSEYLTSLRMDHAEVSDSVLKELLMHATRLKELSIANSSSIGDSTLCCLAHYSHRLTSLTIDNSSITDVGVSAILGSLPITHLSAAFCCHLTGEDTPC
ncbi:hypothetical protein WA171_001911 [Blastocystis sp. BT1]